MNLLQLKLQPKQVILMPLTTDLEFSTWSEISCTCIKLKQFIQDKIKQFIVQTKITNQVLGTAQVIARSYLSKHNWNLKKAIAFAYDELNGEYWRLKSYVENMEHLMKKWDFIKAGKKKMEPLRTNMRLFYVSWRKLILDLNKQLP